MWQAKKRPQCGVVTSPEIAHYQTLEEKGFCLRFTNQTRALDTEEKMTLAKLGLGLKELSFEMEGDSLHVHSVILSNFVDLEKCSGYRLMRLATNSTDLITIDTPREGGISIRCLKDILKAAQLYIVPLQKDIIIEEKSDDVFEAASE